jgi:hypothetical protein
VTITASTAPSDVAAAAAGASAAHAELPALKALISATALAPPNKTRIIIPVRKSNYLPIENAPPIFIFQPGFSRSELAK